MREKELVKLRKKVYQLLKVNDATNKVSWWNLSDDVVDLIESERERAIEDFITKMYGKRCKGIGIGCVVCAMWELYDEYINKLKK